MTREAIEYFKFNRKIFCDDHLKICPKDSIAYQATLKEKEFYDMAIKALEQEPRKGHWVDEGFYAEGHSEHAFMCSECDWHFIGNKSELLDFKYCPFCGAKMAESEET